MKYVLNLFDAIYFSLKIVTFTNLKTQKYDLGVKLLFFTYTGQLLSQYNYHCFIPIINILSLFQMPPLPSFLIKGTTQ